MNSPTNSGDLVENFSTVDQDNNPISLSDFKASPVILFFYPRADTSGCTLEACAFRDIYKEILASGVVLLGISRDDVQAQKKFASKFLFRYPLLADPELKICDYFGLVKRKSMYGNFVKGVERTTYLIAPADQEGHQRLLHVWPKVKPEGHAQNVLDYLKANKIGN